MIVGERLRFLRKSKRLTQRDIEGRTGLLSSYLSRVENGHTVPQLETLEKLARAVEVPLYYFFYEGDKPPESPILPKQKSEAVFGRVKSREDARFWRRLLPLLPHLNPRDRQLLLFTAQELAKC